MYESHLSDRGDCEKAPRITCDVTTRFVVKYAHVVVVIVVVVVAMIQGVCNIS